MERFVLLDIDNCIANDGWRIPSIDWRDADLFRRYHEYHLLAPWDECGNFDLFTGREERIVLLTSRPLFYRRSTQEWLQRHGVNYAHLFMRNNWDHRPSLHIKRGQLEALFEYGIDIRHQIVCAYDDRPEICVMYREHGIRAEVRALHDVCAYSNPITKANHVDGSQR